MDGLCVLREQQDRFVLSFRFCFLKYLKYFTQIEAWGTHGLKLEIRELGIPNTDPLRYLYTNETFGVLPSDACWDNWDQDEYHYFHYYNTQYYLAPGLDPQLGNSYYLAAFNQLFRK